MFANYAQVRGIEPHFESVAVNSYLMTLSSSPSFLTSAAFSSERIFDAFPFFLMWFGRTGGPLLLDNFLCQMTIQATTISSFQLTFR